jgi:cell filamentation protein
MGEVNALHPFREGNGRTCREFFRELSLSAGHILDWGSADKEELLVADVSAFERDYTPLVAILETIVSKGR